MDEVPDFETRQETQRAALKEAGFDGPYHMGGDVLSLMGGHNQFCICLTCGSMVCLNDPEQYEEKWLERSIRLHLSWHAEQKQ